MEESRRNQIYDRLGSIKMNLDPKNVIDPRYISEKIGQCHVFTEEVESFYLEVSKELSIKQRALMNSESAFEQAKDDLMSNDVDIASLPSIREREARANTQLKPDQNEIKFYKIDVVELQGLFGAINLKLRNLDRLNKDIKAQLRLMESQIKLGQGPIDGPTTDLIAAMKEHGAEDIFQDSKSSSEENAEKDPTVPLDVASLLQSSEPDEITNDEDATEEIITSEDDVLLTPSESPGMDVSADEEESVMINLDDVLNVPKNLNSAVSITGGVKEDKPVVPEIQVSPKQNMVVSEKGVDGVNFDSLLKQFN
jgi:hypothetical protein